MSSRIRLIASLAAAALPALAFADAPFAPTAAVHQCVQAASQQLHLAVASVTEQPNMAKLISTAGQVGNQLVLRLQGTHGRFMRTLVCTYDRQGRVRSLRQAAPPDSMPAVDANSIFSRGPNR